MGYSTHKYLSHSTNQYPFHSEEIILKIKLIAISLIILPLSVSASPFADFLIGTTKSYSERTGGASTDNYPPPAYPSYTPPAYPSYNDDSDRNYQRQMRKMEKEQRRQNAELEQMRHDNQMREYQDGFRRLEEENSRRSQENMNSESLSRKRYRGY